MKRSLALIAALAAAGCRDREPPAPPPTASPTATPSPSPTSIIRPDVEVERIELPLKPLEASVPFAETGDGLSETAVTKLETILDSEQLEKGGPIVLRGNTDSKGRDEANLHVSRKRAEMVRDWLVDHGVDEDRITVIAMGEQRPVAPNAHLDGTPDEEGRAKNRRVDVSVALPKEEVEEDAQTPETPAPKSGEPAAEAQH